MLAVEVKVEKNEVVKLVGVVVVFVVVVVVAVGKIGVLELFVNCSVEVADAKDVDVDVDITDVDVDITVVVVVVVEGSQVMRRTMMPRRETGKRTRRRRSPIWIRLCFNQIISLKA